MTRALSIPARLFLVVLLAALAASGCRRMANDAVAYKDEIPPPAEPLIRQLPTVGRYGGRFVQAETNNPKTFNAMMANETSSTDITDRLFGFLVDFNLSTQQYEPGIAKSWEAAPDGVTWTFHLRKGAAFSDGHPMTAEDVLFSFEVLYDEKLHPPMQEMLQSDGKSFTLTAPDPYTVIINTGKPHAGLLDALCPGNLPIIPRHVLQESYRNGTFAAAYNVSTPPEKVVTSGAWRLAQHVTNEKTVLVRNPYHYAFDQNKQRLPYLDELVILVVPDQDAADLKFRAGGIDAVDDVKPENYRWYEENQQEGNFTLYDVGASQATHLLWFNLNRVQPPIGGTKPTHGKRLGESFVDPVKYEWFNNRDFRRAISMGIDRDAIITGALYGHGERNWSQMTSSNKEWYSPFISNIHNDFQYEAGLLGFQSSVPPTPFGGQNVYRSSGESHFWFIRQQKPATPEEARIDRVLDEMLTTQDRLAQKARWKEIENIINDQTWFIWLPIQTIKLPVSNRFGNVRPSVMAHRTLWNIDQVFVKPPQN
jgi:peptide/nickel transport system substrate-binding protein